MCPDAPVCTSRAVALSPVWGWGLSRGSGKTLAKLLPNCPRGLPDSYLSRLPWPGSLSPPSHYLSSPPWELSRWAFSQHPLFNLLETEVISFLPLFPSHFSETVQILQQTFLPVSQLCWLFEYVGRGRDLKQNE